MRNRVHYADLAELEEAPRARGYAMTPLKTAFGKRHGWEIQREIQHVMLVGAYRRTGRTWCRGATVYEASLWRLLKKLDPEHFKVSR